MSRLINELIGLAQKAPKKIIFPEIDDDRMLLALKKIIHLHIAEPVLYGKEQEILDRLSLHGINKNAVKIYSEKDEDLQLHLALQMSDMRELEFKLACKMMQKPLFFGGMTVREGLADGMVAGISSLTASVLRAGLMTIGLKEGQKNPVSLVIVNLKKFNKVLILTDCAVNVDPSIDELIEIGITTGDTAKQLLSIEPKIAFLSFSTKGSTRNRRAKKIEMAAAAAAKLRPDLKIDGEFQFDAAFVPEIARFKAGSSPVGGNANVLVFPNLEAANIGVKIMQHLTETEIIGALIQGFNKPVNDLSRGSSVDEIVWLTALTVVQCNYQGDSPGR